MNVWWVGLYANVAVRWTLFIINSLYTMPAYCVWIFLLYPLRWASPEMYWRLEGLLFHWLTAMVSFWNWLGGYDLLEMGDDLDLCSSGRTLVLANHQSTADVPLLMSCFNARKGIVPHIMWIMSRRFKYTNFGLVSILRGDFFVLSGKTNRDESLRLFKDHVLDTYLPRGRKFMVLFPEGGFLKKRKHLSKKYALENNLPVFEHVSLPRMGVFRAIIDLLSEPRGIEWVLDITVAYPGGEPLDMYSMISGTSSPTTTLLLYRIYPFSDIPRGEADSSAWLIDRWREKEYLLDKFYDTGEMDYQAYCSSPIKPRIIRQSLFRFMLVHAFFLVSTYLQFKLIRLAIYHLLDIPILFWLNTLLTNLPNLIQLQRVIIPFA